MLDYLDLDRRFGLLSRYSVEDLFASEVLGKRLAWERVLEGRFSLIIARANFGKSTEMAACAERLRRSGRHAVFVALRKLLEENDFSAALLPDDDAALSAWRQAPGQRLCLFVDSLDEASLGRESGLQSALRKVSRAVSWPNRTVSWVLSSRPATLTPEVLGLVQAELRTFLHESGAGSGAGSDGDTRELFRQSLGIDDGGSNDDLAAGFDEASANSSAEVPVDGQEPLKVYALLALDDKAARHYLAARHRIADPAAVLEAARRFGLGGLREGPGSLDVLAWINPVKNAPQDLSEALDLVIRGVQEQQRADRRERLVGHPSPGAMVQAVERLASASVVCQSPNIELSPEALQYREGVLSARSIVGSILSEDSLSYLLGSRLFIDSGHYQVKLYPEELVPLLAARRLSSLVQSPEDAKRLLASFAWSASTGECGVHRIYLPLAGWLATLNVHCRHELQAIEPQAVAFFGDLRSPRVSLAEAAAALRASIERLVTGGDDLGRRHYTLTAENYWQAGRPGIEPVLRELFDLHGEDWHARDALLAIATHSRLDVLRASVLRSHGGDYAKLIGNAVDLRYILALERNDDGDALAKALIADRNVGDSATAALLGSLAWKSLDRRAIVELVGRRVGLGLRGFHIDWALTHEVADAASAEQLHALTRSLLLRLSRSLAANESSGDGRREADFVGLVMDMLALVIERRELPPARASRLCRVMQRLVVTHHFGTVDQASLRAAIKVSSEVRRSLIRRVLAARDHSREAVWTALFSYVSFVHCDDGDVAAISDPVLADLVAERKALASRPVPPSPRSVRTPEIGAHAMGQLGEAIEGIRDASNLNALAWVAAWLSRTAPNARYGECEFGFFEEQAGAQVAAAVRSGLSLLWRAQAPTWKENETNSTHHLTIAGLQGLHLELGDGNALPVLNEEEVRQAISYARFEINGYPKWFWPLVHAHEGIALAAFRAILGGASAGAVSAEKAGQLMRHLDEAPASIQRGLSVQAWSYVTGPAEANQHATEAALRVATVEGGSIDRPDFEKEAWTRMTTAFQSMLPELGDAPVLMTSEEALARQQLEVAWKDGSRRRANAVVWGLFWFWHFPDSFGQAWEAWRARARGPAEEFMFDLAARIGEERGTQALRDVASRGAQGLATLKTLFEWVVSVVLEQDDVSHANGRAYSPGARDHAQRLREALLPAIASAKSQAAYDVLEGLRGRADRQRAKYIRHLQLVMREDEAAMPPLPQAAYDKFEHDLAPPVTDHSSFAHAVHNDLLKVRRDIERGEYSLRRFFSSIMFEHVKTDSDGLALEEDFQSLLASELNHASRGRYTVTLEPILPELTRRDVLCQAGTSRATIELKMSERWTLDHYMTALDMQLKGQYMRAPDSKIGFFVVVLQRPRKWRRSGAGSIDFERLLEILAARARELQAADPALFLRVVGIDATPVQGFRSPKPARQAAGKARRAAGSRK